MQPAANGAYRHFENLGDLFITVTFKLPQDQHRAVLVVQADHGGPHQGRPLVARRQREAILVCRRRQTAWELVQRAAVLLFPPPTDRQVHGDAVHPGVKRRIAPKRVQLDERLHEGVLHHVLGVVQRTHQVNDRVEQPILIPQHQVPERRRIALEGAIDQRAIRNQGFIGRRSRRLGSVVPHRFA